ncbi:ATP-binding protein [Spirosoma flavus]
MLKRVSIQNFKSLKDVTLDLQKVNLLIGPNNSGKTNFLKALEFFEFGVLQDDVAAERLARSFRFKRSADSLGINLTFQKGIEELTFHRGFDFSKNTDVKSSQSTTREGLLIAVNDQGYPDVMYLRRQLDFLKIYRPDPNILTKPGPVGDINSEYVTANASNLEGFLDLMLGKFRKTIFYQIESDLQKCISEFGEIILEGVGVTEELTKLYDAKYRNFSFKKLGLKDIRQDIIYWADELSEGTLYFLALLCIINQPNPPKLLLLEEPEKGIHPRRIWEVMKFIFQLAEEKDIQIIMTTHNEHVVNAFSSMPESVFVFDKNNETGATEVRNLQKDIIEPGDRKSEELGLDKIDLTSNLGEYWMYGLIGGVPSDVQ